jgi:hypothetical protein
VAIIYKIISITDREGNDKIDFFNEMQSIHPNMSGEILYPELTKVGTCFCLLWDDDTDKMLRTSTIEKYQNDDEKVEVVTRNSIYILERIK